MGDAHLHGVVVERGKWTDWELLMQIGEGGEGGEGGGVVEGGRLFMGEEEGCRLVAERHYWVFGYVLDYG